MYKRYMVCITDTRADMHLNTNTRDARPRCPVPFDRDLYHDRGRGWDGPLSACIDCFISNSSIEWGVASRIASLCLIERKPSICEWNQPRMAVLH
jgi:hypothetical protein